LYVSCEQYPGVWMLYADVSEHCSIFIGGYLWRILHTYPPMKMEQCSETSEYKSQAPRNYPEEIIQHSEHGESLKSRIFLIWLIFKYLYTNYFLATCSVVSACHDHKGNLTNNVFEKGTMAYSKLRYTSQLVWLGTEEDKKFINEWVNEWMNELLSKGGGLLIQFAWTTGQYRKSIWWMITDTNSLFGLIIFPSNSILVVGGTDRRLSGILLYAGM